MIDARTRAVKSHRKRLRKRRMRRVAVTVREPDVVIVRDMAAALRRDDATARRLRAIVRQAIAQDPEPSIDKVLNSLPDISGAEFDAVFDEIERSRRHPAIMQVRGVDL
jgi:hypothetical protein